MYFIKFLPAIVIIAFTIGCNNNTQTFDAQGTFESDEIIVSSQANGEILQLNIIQGQKLTAGLQVGFVDSVQLQLKKRQVMAQIKALLSRKPVIELQLAPLHEQLKNAETEKIRLQNLVAANAATTKQLDDINAQILIIKKQIDAQQSALQLSCQSINNESAALQAQVDQLNDQLFKCKIINKVNGIVIEKYAYANEITAAGKPLYRVANLDTVYLRAYITGNQLAQIKINQKVNVFTDNGLGSFHKAIGTVVWVSSKAEFTPKTIQTKNERANLVYAVKVMVPNNGLYKIGMYGQLNF